MAKVTFQVLAGIDKGRIFRELATPVTIGREEGNLLRLNDERVSRFHAKVQQDENDVIITDLESTNGTRVNGTVVQIRRLRHGDRVAVGRSLLLYGSSEEIAARMASIDARGNPTQIQHGEAADLGPATLQVTVSGKPQNSNDLDFDLNVNNDKITLTDEAFYIGVKALPPLPLKLTPSQAARFAEILDFLHQGLISATENLQAKDDGTEVTLQYNDWQRIQIIQMILARYIRAVTDPDSLNE